MNNPVEERISAIAIETTEATLRREAQHAQKAWFADPDSTVAKARFAAALRRWAKEARSKKALAQAERLLGEL